MSSIPQRVASYSTSVEINTKANEFCRAARVLALAGDTASGQQMAERFACARAFQQVITKAATPAGLTSDATWAGPLVPLQTLADGFIASLRDAAAFDRLLDGGMIRLPMNTRVAIVTAGASGAGGERRRTSSLPAG